MAKRQTKQLAAWAGDWGDAYVDRNPQTVAAYEKLYRNDYGVTRESMDRAFLGKLDKKISVLEVGSNVGVQLELLHKLGFKNLLGVDVNEHAVQIAKRIRPEIDIIKGSGFDLPFKDKQFDLVFTSGVLIHIAPKDIAKIMKEIYRVSKRYVWGFEYYAPKYTEVLYQGKKNLLWKTDFAKEYIKHCPTLRLVKSKRYTMRDGNVNQMFLLEKH